MLLTAADLRSRLVVRSGGSIGCPATVSGFVDARVPSELGIPGPRTLVDVAVTCVLDPCGHLRRNGQPSKVFGHLGNITLLSSEQLTTCTDNMIVARQRSVGNKLTSPDMTPSRTFTAEELRATNDIQGWRFLQTNQNSCLRIGEGLFKSEMPDNVRFPFKACDTPKSRFHVIPLDCIAQLEAIGRMQSGKARKPTLNQSQRNQPKA
ncbi:hypothetical protein CLF_110384 [Clonorchis sinensis]|uniref:Uncharacterized protein n=1 Tax=Clonorchis sinensis TaxID=79923 RepID=G7YKM0_CLOSI|nr:hypothetical protein CLF_110384 [Clonorchis sinensis]